MNNERFIISKTYFKQIIDFIIIKYEDQIKITNLQKIIRLILKKKDKYKKKNKLIEYTKYIVINEIIFCKVKMNLIYDYNIFLAIIFL